MEHIERFGNCMHQLMVSVYVEARIHSMEVGLCVNSCPGVRPLTLIGPSVPST